MTDKVKLGSLVLFGCCFHGSPISRFPADHSFVRLRARWLSSAGNGEASSGHCHNASSAKAGQPVRGRAVVGDRTGSPHRLCGSDRVRRAVATSLSRTCLVGKMRHDRNGIPPKARSVPDRARARPTQVSASKSKPRNVRRDHERGASWAWSWPLDFVAPRAILVKIAGGFGRSASRPRKGRTPHGDPSRRGFLLVPTPHH